MINKFCASPLWECSQTLAAVAQGRKPAETVIRNAKLINVCTGEILPDTDVAIASGRIALVGNAEHCIGESTAVIDAQGQYIAPGFLDGHIHVESSMMSVGEYARAVVPHGTTGIYMDPHEICNVLGLDGVQCMIEDAKRTPLKTMVTTPSCVPAVPGFEDTGCFIGPKEVAETMKWDSVVGLGEMMNFPGVLSSSEHAHGELAETLKANKIITGHYSMAETGQGLNAYIASGVRCCHESTREEDALQKMRLGMYAMFREGSAWHDLHEVAKSITQHKIDTRFAVLISDDTHPYTLLSQGHLDHIVRRAVQEGIDVVTAIQMVTINCAQCYQMDHDLGSIAPGKCADIVFINDLEKLEITRVLIDGKTAAKNGKLTEELGEYRYPEWATKSMRVRGTITPESFRIPAEGQEVTARVIEIIPERVGTFERHIKLRVQDGQVSSDTTQDVLKTAVFERHHETGKVGFGFVKGFGIRCGAMASTVAHDAHNLLVIGTNDEDMALAANTLIACGGGMTAVQNGKVLGTVPLPIAGLMNDKPLEEMSRIVENLSAAWKQIGCSIVSPFMTMALIPLACLPELRLTNRGLVDCTTFQFVPLFLPD
ncbi:adenine deaminase [Caproiciproducens galactitolivorans]|uniref:Adenine deaminase n=1 Tax=Caproiciproducens galactitolivorans TaxID=642589 RepID=A0A4Z0Y0L9_9FIRM|nr:adenine deaminase [Caproiciproducens galactitolivorans]QEY35698.1 adenine deaminase [Caproiciproducens galactitolivorans]TGJ77429.1 adenine deaminase [Caproiciproducens galactitolivorans]